MNAGIDKNHISLLINIITMQTIELWLPDTIVMKNILLHELIQTSPTMGLCVSHIPSCNLI